MSTIMGKYKFWFDAESYTRRSIPFLCCLTLFSIKPCVIFTLQIKQTQNSVRSGLMASPFFEPSYCMVLYSINMEWY